MTYLTAKTFITIKNTIMQKYFDVLAHNYRKKTQAK